MLQHRQEIEEDDVQQILSRALNLEVQGGAASLEAMRRAASELGISPEALERAQREHFQEKEHRNAWSEYRRELRRSIFTDALTYFVINAILLVVNYAISDRLSSSLWIAGIWGAFFVIEIYEKLVKDPDTDLKDFEKWKRRRDKRNAKRLELE